MGGTQFLRSGLTLELAGTPGDNTPLNCDDCITFAPRCCASNLALDDTMCPFRSVLGHERTLEYFPINDDEYRAAIKQLAAIRH